MEQEEIRVCLKKMLSPRRYQHSLGVAQEAARLAEQYGSDPEKAYLAGLVHDCAKEIPPETSIRMLREDYGIEPDAISLQMPRLLHGALGACVAKSHFGIEDEDILNAVRYHTTGKADMSLLSKLIFIADFIEPGRNYPDVDHLRSLTYQDLEAGMIYGIDFTIEDLLKKRYTIHPDTIHCRNDLLVRREEKEGKV